MRTGGWERRHFQYLPTDDMPANIMTKALHRPKHEKFSVLLGLSRTDHCDNSLLSQWGGVLESMRYQIHWYVDIPSTYLDSYCSSSIIVLFVPHPLENNIYIVERDLFLSLSRFTINTTESLVQTPIEVTVSVATRHFPERLAMNCGHKPHWSCKRSLQSNLKSV